MAFYNDPSGGLGGRRNAHGGNSYQTIETPQSPGGGIGGNVNGMRTPGPLPFGQRRGYGVPTDYSGYKFKPKFGDTSEPVTLPHPPSPPPAAGSQSGPGILESWFNQRAQGIDAASKYATKRGLDALNDRYAAAGMANSGAARQGDADLLANIEAQRAGQLDALAGGASGEHQRRLDSMFGQGTAIAGGQSGINSAYDLSAAQVQGDALKAALGYFLNKAGVDDKSRQGGINNILGILGLGS